MAPTRGFGPPACRLGVFAYASYRVVRDALTCPQTRMNQRFLKERHVTECWQYRAIIPVRGAILEGLISRMLARY